MNVNTEVKGQLAKLLATENLHIEHRKISTAYFDVKKRILALPIWKDVTGNVYDMLVGHEVGHALYTPCELLEDAPKDFVNVVEDARIEKMMKKTYPGLRKSFYQGYNELFGRDFFGVKDQDLNKVAFIDRINLHYKIGSLLQVPFNDEELPWVKRVGECETFQEVKQCAIDLYEYCEGKQKDKEKEEIEDIELPMASMGNGGSTPDGDQEKVTYEPVQSDPSSDEKSETDGSHPEPSGKDDPAQLEVPSYSAGTHGTEEASPDETIAATQQAFEEAQEELVDDSAKEWVYLDLPKVDAEKAIVSYKKILEDLKYHFLGQAHVDATSQKYYNDQLMFNFDKFNTFKKSSVKTVNYLVKQFEMKKSADNYQRQATSKSGVINTNSLYKYKISEDIFKRVTTVPDGKNHGLVMHLDWSGSMTVGTPTGCILTDTLKQVYNLIWFCKKVNIPFRVYGFSNGWNGDELSKCVTPKENALAIEGTFQLFEFFTSKMNNKELEAQMKYLWVQAWCMKQSYGINYCSNYSLGGTPLGEAVLCTKSLVKKLKQEERVDKVNVVILSDGESNPLSYYQQRDSDWSIDSQFRTSYLCHNRGKLFILRDRDSRYSKRIKSDSQLTTKEIVGFMKEVTDYNWIGIRIGDKSDMNSIMEQCGYAWTEQSAINKQWSKERFVNTDKYGYSELLILGSSSVGGDTHDLDVKVKGSVATAGELTRAFKKHMNSKMTNKLILNKFVEQIA